FSEYYRIEQIVRAMPYIVAKNPGTILILLKGGTKDIDFEARIDNIINELGIENNVRLIQQELSPTEMAVLYNASDVLVSIPKTDLFAISIQEGMACGVIPIVANLEVYQQYLIDGENGYIVDPQYPQQIAEKIIHCIEHPELRNDFYKINRKIIEENENWDKNMVKMEALYDSIIKKAGSV
ncbi:MAG: glycosyltransferase, partial [Dehalococcoidia bacterium]